MKIKLALAAAALLGCQLFCPLAHARTSADQQIDILLQSPLQSIAQTETTVVPNGLPYVPPAETEVSGSPSFSPRSGHRGRRAGSSVGHKRSGKGRHKRTLSSAKRRSQTASVGDSSCCAPSSEM